MKTYALALAATLVTGALGPGAIAADEPPLQRLVLCQDSWFDWKDDDVRMARFAGYFESRFDRGAQGDAFAPKAPLKLLGYPVAQVYPQSVGMGVGFSALIDADFAQARASIEQQLGKPMTCSTSDGVRACELKLGPKKTALLMTGQNGQARTSLVGCYYFYQQ